MSLSRGLSAALEGLPSPAPMPYPLSAEDAGHRLSLELTAAGPVGLAFETLEYAAADRSERSPEALRAWADRLAAKVTYLMEPLAVIEHDRVAGEVEVRSQSPTRRNDRRTYYEARVRRDGTMTLSRLSYDEATKVRQTIPCQMTVEVLERLADDLVACSG